MKAIVVIPTYNEIDNVPKMIDAVLAQHESLEVLIVDDSSPDGTGNYVKERMAKDKRIHLVVGEEKRGIGPAYIMGFRYALTLSPDYVIQMDADFSHDPKVLKTFLREIKHADLVIGSRYCNGISVINWPLRRLLLSYFGNLYVRIILGSKIKDVTGGFKCFRASVLKAMDFDNIRSAGYSFQIEVNHAVERNGFNIKEIPILFAERATGISKMSGNIIIEAFIRVVRLKLRNHKRYFPKLHEGE